MGPVPFKSVTVDEAKEGFGVHAAKAGATMSKEDSLKRRLMALRSPALQTNELVPLAFKWLAILPPNKRPHALARKYPRIANRLADVWKRPIQCERFLDELVMDHRGDRKGFPPDVTTELAALKLYFQLHVSTPRPDVWGNRSRAG
jgi:hypothetical protein